MLSFLPLTVTLYKSLITHGKKCIMLTFCLDCRIPLKLLLLKLNHLKLFDIIDVQMITLSLIIVSPLP